MTDKTQQIIATYNKIAKQYAKNLAVKGHRKELEKFFPLVKPHGKILDIGCAAGRYSRALKDKGFEVVGIDLSEELLKIAKKENPDIPFILADMRKLPFLNESFDSVCAIAVLHHLEKHDMDGALQEMRRVLKPGGILWVSTKMGEGALTTSDSLAEGEEREFTLLTEDGLDSMLRGNGFKKIDLYHEESSSRKGLFWIVAFYKKV